MAAIVLDEGLADRAWLAENAVGFEEASAALASIPIAAWCDISGVDEELVRAAVRRLAAASSVAVFEDLGIQMNRHSTLVSYLEKLVWLLTGNFASPGRAVHPIVARLAGRLAREGRTGEAPRTPVLGERIIAGLVPCNVIADEILTDHPDRFRAMVVRVGEPRPLVGRLATHAGGVGAPSSSSS